MAAHGDDRGISFLMGGDTVSTMEMASARPAETRLADADLEFVARARAGDRDAFEVLFRRHYGRIYAIVSRVLDRPQDREDAVQDTFVRAYGGLAGFREEASFSTWLSRIAINVALRRARRGRALPLSLTRVGPECHEVEPPDPVDVQQLVEQRDVALAVRQAVANLPPKHRLVVSLRYFDGYSCEEIARLLDCSVGTVWSRLHYAHRRLRRSLEGRVIPSEFDEATRQDAKGCREPGGAR